MGAYLSSKRRAAGIAGVDLQPTSRLAKSDAQLQAHNAICGPLAFVEFTKISAAYGGKKNFAVVEITGGGSRKKETKRKLGLNRATVLEVDSAGPPKLHCSQCDKLIATREGDVKRNGNKPFYACVNCRLVGRKVHLCSSCYRPPDKAEELKMEILASTHTYQKYSMPPEHVASEPGTTRRARRTTKRRGARQNTSSSLKPMDSPSNSSAQRLAIPEAGKPAERARTNRRFSSAASRSSSENSSQSSSRSRDARSPARQPPKQTPKAPTRDNDDVPEPFEQAPTAPAPDLDDVPKRLHRRRRRKHRSRKKMERAASKDSDASNLSRAVLLAQPAEFAQHLAYIPSGAEVSGTGEMRGEYIKVLVSLDGQVIAGWLRNRHLKLQSEDDGEMQDLTECEPMTAQDSTDCEPMTPEPMPTAPNVAEAGFLPGAVDSRQEHTMSPRPSSAGSRRSDSSSERSQHSGTSRASSSISETDPAPCVRERPISYRQGGSWD